MICRECRYTEGLEQDGIVKIECGYKYQVLKEERSIPIICENLDEQPNWCPLLNEEKI